MDYEKKVPEWHAEGTEPPESLKQSGFEAGYKPPAAYFNWFWNRVSACLTEIRSKLSGHAANKENPHGVTAAQVGLDKVNNTPDTEKNVAFASESALSRKVENNLVLRFNGGGVENTNLFTYNGSGGKSVNITPAKINAAEKDLSNVDEDTFKAKATDSGVGIPIAAATSADGIAYTATVDGVTELYNGLIITIIPDINSASTTPTLDVNGIGAKMVRLPLSFNNAAMTTPRLATYISAGRPLTLQYDAAYLNNDGIWKVFGKQRTSAQDLYGTVPIEGGGTGATDAETALANLKGVPIIDASGAANDMDEISKTGKFAWYRYDGNTLNTPMKAGVTGAALGYILNIPNGGANAPYYNAQLAVCNGGHALFYRYSAGNSIGNWTTLPNANDIKQRDRVVNLLDNSDFTQPVNQCGETSYSTAGYTIDMWRLDNNAGAVTVNDGYITLSASGGQCWFTQKFERYLTVGQIYTLYVELADDTIHARKFTVLSSQSSLDAGWGILVYQKEMVSLVISNGNAKNVRRVALYEGEYTAETVPTYQPKGYVTELVKCMRYYQVGDLTSFTQGASAVGALGISARFPVPMRISPTVTSVIETKAIDGTSYAIYAGTPVENGTTNLAYNVYLTGFTASRVYFVKHKYTADARL